MWESLTRDGSSPPSRTADRIVPPPQGGRAYLAGIGTLLAWSLRTCVDLASRWLVPRRFLERTASRGARLRACDRVTVPMARRLGP
jgi:hypothetical protein